ncbi:MAG: hypothetical protein GY799_34095 [Desulfobulbaceae bacterium]|nr:hypothetical protein [Desulfobulbaceae bacterium]
MADFIATNICRLSLSLVMSTFPVFIGQKQEEKEQNSKKKDEEEANKRTTDGGKKSQTKK